MSFMQKSCQIHAVTWGAGWKCPAWFYVMVCSGCDFASPGGRDRTGRYWEGGTLFAFGWSVSFQNMKWKPGCLNQANSLRAVSRSNLKACCIVMVSRLQWIGLI